MILRSLVLRQYQCVTDGRRDRQMDVRTDAHSSGNNVLNVPNLSLLRMYALTHVLCFRFLFLTSDIAMAAPTLANSSEVHATTST